MRLPIIIARAAKSVLFTLAWIDVSRNAVFRRNMIVVLKAGCSLRLVGGLIPIVEIGQMRVRGRAFVLVRIKVHCFAELTEVAGGSRVSPQNGNVAAGHLLAGDVTKSSKHNDRGGRQ